MSIFLLSAPCPKPCNPRPPHHTSATSTTKPNATVLREEQLLQLSRSVLGTRDAVANHPRVGVHLVIVAAREGLVAEEVDGGVLHAVGHVGLVLDVLQAVRLVPAAREDVEGYLAADGVSAGRARRSAWGAALGPRRSGRLSWTERPHRTAEGAGGWKKEKERERERES